MLTLFKEYLKDEGGWVALAMAATSMVSGFSKKRKQMKAAVENAKLQRAKLNRARTRQASDFATNTQRAREAAQAREINMEENSLRGESAFAETFAGSGISGTSMDDLDAQMDTELAKNKFQNKKALNQQLGDMYQKNLQNTEDINADVKNIGADMPSSHGLMEAAGDAAAGYQSGVGIGSAAKKFDARKGTGISKFLGF